MVGFCLDTCHAHAGGNALETVVADVLAITGRIDLVHCNDSRDDFDSGADRHANLGAGRIDADLLAAVIRDAGAPVVCETPGERRRARRRLRVAARAGLDVFTNSHARTGPWAGMLRSEGLERRRGAFGSLIASPRRGPGPPATDE